MILGMMTIEQRIMAGEDPAKIMQEIELAKEKKTAADERKRTAARKASEEQLKRAREKVVEAITEYMRTLGLPQSALDELIEAFTEDAFKEIEFKIKLLMPLITAVEKMESEPRKFSRNKSATGTITKEADTDTIINDFLKSLM